MKFKITQYVSGYTKIDGDYKFAELEAHYNCGTWDDMQNIIATIVEASDKPSVKFMVERVEEKEG